MFTLKNNWLLVIIISTVSLSFVIQLPNSFAQETTSTSLSPIDDVYVAIDHNNSDDKYDYSNKNARDAQFIKIWHAWNVTETGNEKIQTLGYLKFDLSHLPKENIENATLSVFVYVSNLLTKELPVDVYLAASNDWSENTITYNSKPDYDLLVSSTMATGSGGWYSWDLTDAVQENLGSEMTLVFQFREFVESREDNIAFFSKEAFQDYNRPFLEIKYSGVIEIPPPPPPPIPTCRVNQELVNGECVDIAVTPHELTCGPGTEPINGVCQIIQGETPEKPMGNGCLIATATYGSELSAQVQQLRELRDDTLLESKVGSAFMAGFNQFYYSFSPTISDWERQNPVFKEFVKVAITPLITTLSILQYVDIDSEEKILGYGIGIILLNVGMYFAAPAIIITKLAKLKKIRKLIKQD